MTSRIWIAIALLAAPVQAQPEPPKPDDPPPSEPPPPEPPQDPPPQPEPPKTGTIAGMVEAPDLDAPLAGATIVIVTAKGAPAITTTTDEEGRFELANVAPGTVRVRADFAGFKSEERTVLVAAGVTAKLDFKLATLPAVEEMIVVVGSRTPRTKLETTVPIDVITADDIARSGRTETGRVLHALAASYVSTPQTIADGTDHIDPASLRGLGPDQVLILVNGKRRHRSALLHINGTFGRGTVGTDLNAIPIGSIKRIEILRDGAASQYGSDAIAGVINIVTKDTTGVLEMTAETGITARRDGAQFMTFGNYGFKVGDTGYVNLTGQFLQREATNRSGTYTGTVYNDDPVVDDQLLAERGLTRDDFRMKIGEAAATAGMGAFNLELPLTDIARFYAFGDLTHRRSAAAGFYRFPKQTSQTVAEFYPDGFLPEIHPTIDDNAITIGVRRAGELNVDASLTRGHSAFKLNIENSVNASLGTSSPTTFDAGTLEFEQTVANLDLVRRVDTERFKALSIVFGSEVRVENYRIVAGDEASFSVGDETFGDPPQPKVPGAQVFPGFQPSNEVDRTRDNVGVYAGVESEVNKRVAVDVGGRFEVYSDFGRSVIGKVATRAKLSDAISVRAAASTGFRAPSLHQLWFSNISTLFLLDAGGVLQPTQVLTSNNESPITRAFGIPELREERSINGSAGVLWRWGDHFSATVDGYFIRIRDRIVLTGQFTNTNPIVAEILAPFPGVSQAQFFANAVDTDTVGGDLVVDFATTAGDGTLALTGAANYTRTTVERVNIPRSLSARFGADPAQLNTFFFGRLAKNRLEDAIPRHKGNVAARYTIGRLSALARANYYGPVFFKPDDRANDEKSAAKVVFDADVGFQITKHKTIAVGADNLLNTFPDRQTKPANISSGRFVYSRNVSQFGMNGGFYYVKLVMTL